MMDDIGVITDDDVRQAVALWTKYAPAQYRVLITGGGSRFGWDNEARQFFYKSNGRRIDRFALRNLAIEPFIFQIKILMRAVSEKMQKNTATVDQWKMEMQSVIRHSQIAVGLVANGGDADSENNDVILLSISAMLAFFTAFVLDIRRGDMPLNGLILSRSDLYASALRDAYEETIRGGIIAAGSLVEERRVLDPGANHCHTDAAGWTGCPELARRGWQIIGTLPRLYDTPCRTNCKCHFEYR